MRAVPTTTVSSVSTFLTLQATEAYNPTMVTVGGASNAAVEMRFQSSSIDNGGQSGWLRLDTGGYMKFDAEL